MIFTDCWFGPPLNKPGHDLHGCVPVIDRRNGKFAGWVRPGGRLISRGMY